MAGRSRVRSRVDELPEHGRMRLNEMLADVSYTYQDIVDELEQDGYEISRSAVARYAARHNASAMRLKQAQEQTTALLNVFRENKDIESTELAVAILTDGITRRIAMADEEYEDIPLEKAGRLLVQLQRSSVYKERWAKHRETLVASVEQNIMRRMRELLKDMPDLLAQLQTVVAEAAAEEMRRDDA